MNVNQYFSHYIVPDKVNKATVISERYSAHHQKTIGVFSGSESVCVINTGMGMNGNLRHYIEDVVGTDKTIECVCLTGNPEDVGGAALFDAAYLNEKQKTAYIERGCNEEARREQFAKLSHNSEESIAYGKMLMYENKNICFRKAEDGFSATTEGGIHRFDNAGEGRDFHLGGTVVQLGELPAQAEGQMIAFSPTLCIAFVGDAIEPVTHLENLTRTGMQKYADCLERAIEHIVADSLFSEGMKKTPPALYCSNSPEPMGIEVARNILKACREVLEGDIAHDAPSGGRPGQRMHFVNNDCIIYDAKRLEASVSNEESDK